MGEVLGFDLVRHRRWAESICNPSTVEVEAGEAQEHFRPKASELRPHHKKKVKEGKIQLEILARAQLSSSL